MDNLLFFLEIGKMSDFYLYYKKKFPALIII